MGNQSGKPPLSAPRAASTPEDYTVDRGIEYYENPLSKRKPSSSGASSSSSSSTSAAPDLPHRSSGSTLTSVAGQNGRSAATLESSTPAKPTPANLRPSAAPAQGAASGGGTRMSIGGARQNVVGSLLDAMDSGYHKRASLIAPLNCANAFRPKNYEPFVITMEGHTGRVRSVCFSPDGSEIASGSGDKTIRIWSAVTGKLIQTLTDEDDGHSVGIRSVCYNPVSKLQLIASGSKDKTVKVWNANTSELITSLREHAGSVYTVCFSPDGATLASGSSDKTIILWDCVEKKIKHTLKGHSNAVRSVCYSRDGSTIASGSYDSTIKVWSAITGDLRSTFRGHLWAVRSVCFSPDGNHIAAGSDDKTVKLWSTATGDLLRTMAGHTDSVRAVCYSPNGESIASCCHDKTVKVWSASTGDLVQTWKGHTDYVYSVSYSPDGRSIASASWDRTVKMRRIIPVFPQVGGSDFSKGLSRLDSKAVIDGLNKMAVSGTPFDILYWEEYLESTSSAEELSNRLSLLFSAIWQVIEENHAANSEVSMKRSATLQQAVKDLVVDVRQHRPRLFVELIQRLDENHIQKLADTRVMQILITELAKGGVNRLYHCEVVLLTVLIVAFTRTSYLLKFADSVEQVKQDSSAIGWTLCAVVLSGVFLCRELGQIVAMARLKLLGAFAKDIFNYLDLGTFICILASTVIFFEFGPGYAYNIAASLAALLMWLKLLGTIRALNQQIATFVLMLRIIFYDIASFVAVMVLVLTMFGHALFMMLGSADPDSVNGFATVYDTMKTLYISMVTGQYDSNDFPDVYTYTLSAVFLFIVVIVMLNVLIAIVSDSYDAAMVKSAQLFWSARMGLVAEMSTTFGWLLQSKVVDSIGKAIASFTETDDGGEASSVNKQFSLVRILFTTSDNRVSNVIRICFLPVTFPPFFVYIGIIYLLWWIAKWLVHFSSDVELNLGLSSSGGDGRSGRVLDIVNRINQHSTVKVSEMKRELVELKESDQLVRSELSAIHEELKFLRVAGKYDDVKQALSEEVAAMKEDLKREMADVIKGEMEAIKEMLRR